MHKGLAAATVQRHISSAQCLIAQAVPAVLQHCVHTSSAGLLPAPAHPQLKFMDPLMWTKRLYGLGTDVFAWGQIAVSGAAACVLQQRRWPVPDAACTLKSCFQHVRSAKPRPRTPCCTLRSPLQLLLLFGQLSVPNFVHGSTTEEKFVAAWDHRDQMRLVRAAPACAPLGNGIP